MQTHTTTSTLTCALVLAMAAAPVSAKSIRVAHIDAEPTPKLAPFLQKSVEWLIEAQHPNGGWGGGSQANQQQRNPHKVKTDPATTAFTATALIRAGHTPTAGSFSRNVERATAYLVEVVETAETKGPRITKLTGTQPQSKLGGMIDTVMTAQFLGRVLPLLPEDHELYPRVDAALEKCLSKLEKSQDADGTWEAGGWAPILQGAFSLNALENAKAIGKKVDLAVLSRARESQKGNIDSSTGRAEAARGAGVELYAWSTGQRAAAPEARVAMDLIEKAKDEGKLGDDAEVNTRNLVIAGIEEADAIKFAKSHKQVLAQSERLDDKGLIAGFGNRGGEEYLSYMLTSESLFLTNREEWEKWNDKMLGLCQKVQAKDGSFTGHHCLTSPVFCTSAVVQCLTVDRDAELLKKVADAAEAAVETTAKAQPETSIEKAL